MLRVRNERAGFRGRVAGALADAGGGKMIRKACAGFVAAVSLLPLGACRTAPPYPAGLRSDDTSVRLRAIRIAGERRDRAALPLLVPQLEDDDAAVRFYAILAIERITGTRLGYDYAASAADRGRAVKRWQNYLRADSGPASQPIPAATTTGAAGS